MTDSRLINVLSATAALVANHMQLAANQIGRGGESARALGAIGHEPGLTIRRLANALGLTHPGMVRLVDALAADGLVERRASERDGRAVELYLTTKGEDRRSAIIDASEKSVSSLLGHFNAAERRSLERLLDKILRRNTEAVPDLLTTCNLCRATACEDCPTER